MKKHSSNINDSGVNKETDFNVVMMEEDLAENSLGLLGIYVTLSNVSISSNMFPLLKHVLKLTYCPNMSILTSSIPVFLPFFAETAMSFTWLKLFWQFLTTKTCPLKDVRSLNLLAY